MLSEQLLKSNFSGKDGFSWWIGRVAHPEFWKLENLASGHEGSAAHRVKVRIIGYHPWDDELHEKDLPWATVLQDPVTGGGQGSMGDTLSLVGGETAVGFFLDGEEAQQPVIIGLLNRSQEVADSISEEEIFSSGSNHFGVMTGYTGKVVPATKRGFGILGMFRKLLWPAFLPTVRNLPEIPVFAKEHALPNSYPGHLLG